MYIYLFIYLYTHTIYLFFCTIRGHKQLALFALEIYYLIMILDWVRWIHLIWNYLECRYTLQTIDKKNEQRWPLFSLIIFYCFNENRPIFTERLHTKRLSHTIPSERFLFDIYIVTKSPIEKKTVDN